MHLFRLEFVLHRSTYSSGFDCYTSLWNYSGSANRSCSAGDWRLLCHLCSELSCASVPGWLWAHAATKWWADYTSRCSERSFLLFLFVIEEKSSPSARIVLVVRPRRRLFYSFCEILCQICRKSQAAAEAFLFAVCILQFSGLLFHLWVVPTSSTVLCWILYF